MTIKPNSPYNTIYLQQEGRCKWCREELSPADLTKDHFLPKRKGHEIITYTEDKTQKIANCVLACGKCNSLKSGFTLAKFATRIRKRWEKEPNSTYYRQVLQSILEAQLTNEALRHQENLRKARTEREIRAQRSKKTDLVGSSQSVSDPEVGVYPQITEKVAPEPQESILRHFRSGAAGIFAKTMNFLNKLR